MPVLVDMGSILAAADATVNSGEFQKEQDAYIQAALEGHATLVLAGGTVHSAAEAADKFISVLQDHIGSCGLSAGAAAAISGLAHGEPVCSGGRATVNVFFTGDMHRESLASGKYPGGISNLEELLNNGVDHVMRPVHGQWHGQSIWSRTSIPGAHFIESAKQDFMASFGSEYHVVDINIEYAH